MSRFFFLMGGAATRGGGHHDSLDDWGGRIGHDLDCGSASRGAMAGTEGAHRSGGGWLRRHPRRGGDAEAVEHLPGDLRCDPCRRETERSFVPALNMAGSELNAMGVVGTPLRNAKFVIVFHGAAIDGILDDAHYRAKFGVANPNLRAIAEMKKAGVELFVCGQNVAFAKIDPTSLSRDVTIASDALLVLMKYQNDGYALLSF